jgi:hypothetical protein
VEIPVERKNSTQEPKKIEKIVKPKNPWRDVSEEGTREVEEATTSLYLLPKGKKTLLCKSNTFVYVSLLAFEVEE